MMYDPGNCFIEATPYYFYASKEIYHSLYNLQTTNNENEVSFQFQSLTKHNHWENINVIFWNDQNLNIKEISHSLTCADGVFKLKFRFRIDESCEKISFEMCTPKVNHKTTEILLAANVNGVTDARMIDTNNKVHKITNLSFEEIIAALTATSAILDPHQYQKNSFINFSALFLEALMLKGSDSEIIADFVNQKYQEINALFYQNLSDISDDMLRALTTNSNKVIPAYFQQNIILNQIKEKADEFGNVISLHY